jgi:hypothetical protein
MRSPSVSRAAVAAGFVTAALLAAPDALAQEDDDAEETEEELHPDPAFRYTTPAPSNIVRALAEQLGILLVGFGHYWTEKDANAADWDLGYNWQDFRSKLLFEAFSFDNNRFDTNWLTHPVAGYFYYSAARGNRLGILPSFALAFASSTVWEYVGEFRERVSANDMITTPFSAVSLGESTTQLGAFFHRSRPTTAAKIFGWVFAPFKSAHDAIDGVEPERPGAYDDLGFPADVWHQFRVRSGGGVTAQQDGVTQGDVRLALDSRIVTLPDYGGAGRHSASFDAGEVSSLWLQGAVGGGDVVDLQFGGSVIAAGFYHRDVVETASGLVGHGSIVGLNFTTEYMRHRYDRDGRRPVDRIALVAAGASVEQMAYAGPVAVRASVDLLASFAGVSAYAWKDYEHSSENVDRIASVIRLQRYYHGYGGTVRPALAIEGRRFDAGADLRVDWFRAITGLDREQELVPNEVGGSDRRAMAGAWIGVSPTPRVRFSVRGERNERAGRLGAVTSERSELGLYGGVDFRF